MSLAHQQALLWHAQFGRNPSSLVAVDEQVRFFSRTGLAGGVPYHAVGPVWLAGELLAPAETLPTLMEAFIQAARAARRIPMFAPVGPESARAAGALRLRRVPLGVTPYLWTAGWNLRGARFRRLRGELNRAARHGVQVVEMPTDHPTTRSALQALSAGWLATRRTSDAFGWVFRLAPEQHRSLKRTFVAVDACGTPTAFLSASPLPGRCGWYLEDLVRTPTSLPGVTATLASHAIKVFRDEGAPWVTLGGIPLGQRPGKKSTTQSVELSWLHRPLERWYNFRGVARFKAQFGADLWEEESLLLPSWMSTPAALWAVVQLTLPGGLPSLLRLTP